MSLVSTETKHLNSYKLKAEGKSENETRTQRNSDHLATLVVVHIESVDMNLGIKGL